MLTVSESASRASVSFSIAARQNSSDARTRVISVSFGHCALIVSASESLAAWWPERNERSRYTIGSLGTKHQREAECDGRRQDVTTHAVRGGDGQRKTVGLAFTHRATGGSRWRDAFELETFFSRYWATDVFPDLRNGKRRG